MLHIASHHRPLTIDYVSSGERNGGGWVGVSRIVLAGWESAGGAGRGDIDVGVSLRQRTAIQLHLSRAALLASIPTHPTSVGVLRSPAAMVMAPLEKSGDSLAWRGENANRDRPAPRP